MGFFSGLPGLGGLFGGGGGGSSSMESGGIGNSSSTNNNTDEQFEVGVSTQGGGNATFTRDERSYQLDIKGDGNTLTDFGAVSDSLALALRGVELANSTAADISSQTTTLLGGALTMVGEQQQQFTDAVEKIKTSDVRVLIIASVAVVGVVAFIALRKG
jgi:hypothetical protein